MLEQSHSRRMGIAVETILDGRYQKFNTNNGAVQGVPFDHTKHTPLAPTAKASGRDENTSRCVQRPLSESQAATLALTQSKRHGASDSTDDGECTSDSAESDQDMLDRHGDS